MQPSSNGRRSWHLSFIDTCDGQLLTDHYSRDREVLLNITGSTDSVQDNMEMIREAIGSCDDILPDWVLPTDEEVGELAADIRDSMMSSDNDQEANPLPSWFYIKWSEDKEPETER